MDNVRWGIIGCGSVTEVKSGPALQRADGSRLVAVMRRDAAAAADYARRHGVPRWYADADALIADPEVNAVYVATPVGHHLEYALRVAAAGKPCYVEKPMARSHAECEAMRRAFRDAGLPLFVAYYRRALPRFLAVRDLLASGRLGEIRRVTCRLTRTPAAVDPANLPWRLDARLAGGGLFMDLASHTLDLLDFLFGPLDAVQGKARNRSAAYAVEDLVSLRFTLPGNIAGAGRWDFGANRRDDRVCIEGSRATLRFSTFGDESLRLRTGFRTETFSHPNPAHIQEPLVRTMVNALLGRGTCASTGDSAARTNRVMDAALGDYYGGRDDAFWERSPPGRSKR